MIKKILIALLLIVTLVFSLNSSVSANVVNNTTEEENTIVEEKTTEEKGFIEEYLGIILASSGGTLTGLGVLFFWVIKALKKVKDLTNNYESNGKISSKNANDIKDILDKVEELINVKLNNMFENLNLTKEEIDKLKIDFKEIVNNLNENQNQTMEILKIAFLNDSALVKKGVANILEKEIGIYEQRNNTEETKEE